MDEHDGPKKSHVKSKGGAREKHRVRRELKKDKKEGKTLDDSQKAAKARNPKVRIEATA